MLAIADELTDDGLVLRYRVEETDDGLSGEEGTFTICSFWLVSALVEIGELERARDLCERMLSYASPLQLYAEEIDARSGRHLGNFPQAFTHLALINAVMHVIRADQGLEVGTFGLGQELARARAQSSLSVARAARPPALGRTAVAGHRADGDRLPDPDRHRRGRPARRGRRRRGRVGDRAGDDGAVVRCVRRGGTSGSPATLAPA